MKLLQLLQSLWAYITFAQTVKTVSDETVISGMSKVHPSTEADHTRTLKADPLVEINDRYQTPVSKIVSEDNDENVAAPVETKTELKKGVYSADEVAAIEAVLVDTELKNVDYNALAETLNRSVAAVKAKAKALKAKA